MSDTPAALIIVTLGCYATGVFSHSLYMGWVSARWPRTTAEVRDSGVAVVNIGGRRGPADLEGAALVTYAYMVRGERHRGNRLQYGPQWWWFASRDARAYPPGRIVEIAYNPRKPHESVLRPGVTWSNALVFPVGIGILTTGLIWLLHSLRGT